MIELVEVRARIEVGNNFDVETPFIQSFSVRKTRNQPSTFDASLKVDHEKIISNSIGGDIVIYAGTKSNMNKIFTGVLQRASVSPCWDDPGYVLLNISGVDVLSRLAGKKYTRRCRATKSTWVAITSLARPGLRDGKFSYESDNVSIAADQIIPSNKENTTPANYKSAGVLQTDSAVCSIASNISINEELTNQEITA